METAIVYIIGALAVSYIVITIWRKIKGQGSCCSPGGSDGCGGCSGCGGPVDKCKK